MRHNNKINKLSRDSAHRKALLNNLSESLFIHGYINTTLAKAKVLRPYVEKIITSAKKANEESFIPNRLLNTRNIKRNIKHKDAYHSLIRVWGPLCMNRNGGYTRIIKLGTRLGDAAKMAMIGIVLDDGLLKKYNIDNYGYKYSFNYLSNLLIQDIQQPRMLLNMWSYSIMPKIMVESTFSLGNLNFSILFDSISEINAENWPLYQGIYQKLPLNIRIESNLKMVPHTQNVQIKRSRHKKINLLKPSGTGWL